MIKKSLQSILDEKENYVKRYTSGKKMVCLDIETTGLKGENPLTQVTQLFLQEQTGYQEVLIHPIRLLPENVEKLREEVSQEGHLDDSSLHWVLSLNKHHPLFKYQKDIPGVPEEETKNSILIGEDEDGESIYRTYDIPRKLTDQEFQEFLVEQENYPTEEEALSTLYTWWEGAGEEICVFGHNVIMFDIPFLNSRGSLYGYSFKELHVLDTIWINRLLLLPMLIALKRSVPIGSRMTGWYEGLHVYGKKYSSSLQDLRRVFNLCQDGEAHTAKDDVRTTIELLAFQGKFIDKVSPVIAEDTLIHDLFIDIMEETMQYYKKYIGE